MTPVGGKDDAILAWGFAPRRRIRTDTRLDRFPRTQEAGPRGWN